MKIHVNRVTVESPLVTITFVEGKGVSARGEPYTMAVSNPFVGAVSRLLRERQGHKYLVSQIPAELTALATELRNILREYDSEYELRSARRGALQEMARRGTSLAVLRSISGHRSDAMLLRYLDWGRFAYAQLQPQIDATAQLW